jgi:hypothetical protein
MGSVPQNFLTTKIVRLLSESPIGLGVAVVLVWMTISIGLCGELDGNELLDSCTDALRHVDNGYRSTSAKEAHNYMWCVGYMRGWVDGYQEGATLCVPQKITALQLVRIVVKYLRDHPQRLHYNRGVLILSAVQEAFPCSTHGRNFTDAELIQMGLPAAPTPTPQPGTPPAPPAPSTKRPR